MGIRNLNHRLVKIHRSYTVEEIARLFGTHKNTVRNWLRKGLRTVDERRPLIILGPVLIDYLKVRRAKNKRKCRPGEIYCVRCHEPRRPKDQLAAYRPLTPTSGNLVGRCPRCNIPIFRRVSLAKLSQVSADLQVSIPEAQQHIDESLKPSVNCDFK